MPKAAASVEAMMRYDYLPELRYSDRSACIGEDHG